MGFYEDLMGFVADKFRRQNQQVQAAMDSFRQTGHLPQGLVGSIAGVTPIAGSISPSVWKGVAPELKARVNQLADRAPQFFKQILEDPRALMMQATPKEAMNRALGQIERVNPNLNMMRIRSDQLGGMSNSVLGTILHELQHTQNIDRFANMPKEDASTIGMLLKGVLEEGNARHPSLSSRISEYANKSALGPVDPTEYFADVNPRTWKQLTPEEKAIATTHIPEASDPHESEVMKDVIFGYNKNEPYRDFLHRIIGDEAYAHLSERTQYPILKNIDTSDYSAGEIAALGRHTKLQELAQKLGIGNPGHSPQDLMDLAAFPPMEEAEAQVIGHPPAIRQKLVDAAFGNKPKDLLAAQGE